MLDRVNIVDILPLTIDKHRSKAMTLDYAFRMGLLADIAEDRFWSQATVAIVIAVLSFVAFFIKGVMV